MLLLGGGNDGGAQLCRAGLKCSNTGRGVSRQTGRVGTVGGAINDLRQGQQAGAFGGDLGAARGQISGPNARSKQQRAGQAAQQRLSGSILIYLHGDAFGAT